MDSNTAIAVLGSLLLLAILGLAFMARALEEARDHQQYLRGQVSKYRRMAVGRQDAVGLVNPSAMPTGAGWKLDPPPGRPGVPNGGAGTPGKSSHSEQGKVPSASVTAPVP